MKPNMPQKLVKILFLTALVFISIQSYTNINGVSGGNSGAPSETKCGGCHGAPNTLGNKWSSISLTGVPNNIYTPGQTYTLTLNGNLAAATANGFQITALGDIDLPAGTFTAGTGNTVSINSGRSYVTHNSIGSTQTSWSFQWTAPSSGLGAVVFYVTLVGANGNADSAGDATYYKTFILTPSNLSTPSILYPANGATFCVGDTLQLMGSGTNSPITYEWAFYLDTPSFSNLQNPVINVGSNTGVKNIRLRTISTGGSTGYAEIVIHVIKPPTTQITSSNNCLYTNDSITLSVPNFTGYSYLWSPGGQTTPSIHIKNPGNYAVKLSHMSLPNCLANSDVKTITLQGVKPTIHFTLSKDSICETDSTLITATPGFDYYKFFVDGQGIDSSTSNTKWIKGSMGKNAIIGVSGRNGNCNEFYAQERFLFVIQKPAAPPLSCGPFTKTSTSFNVGGSNTEVSIDGGQTWTLPNLGSVHFVSGLTEGTLIKLMARYPVTGLCQYSFIAEQNCGANFCETSPIEIMPLSKRCDRNFRAIIKPGRAINPYFKYNCSEPSLVLPSGYIKSDSLITFINLSQSKNINFNVSILDSANLSCPVRDTVFTIYFDAGPTLNMSNKFTYCSNEAIELSLNYNNPAAAKANYYINKKWVASGLWENNFSSGFIKLDSMLTNTSLEILAELTDTLANCFFERKGYITIIKEPIFKINYKIGPNSTVTFTYESNSSGIKETYWYINGQLRSTDKYKGALVVNSMPKGIYKVTLLAITDGICTTKVEDTLDLTFLSTENLPDPFGLNIFPNPAQSSITIQWDNDATLLNYELTDITGKSILQGDVTKNQIIDTRALASGVYILQLTDGIGITRKKLQIQ
jgi:hypothetical protein